MVIERTVSAIGSSRPIWSVLLLRLCSSADVASPRPTAANAREGWAQVKRDLAAQTYRFYVLDEFTYPIKWGWVDVEDVVQTLRDRPEGQHVVITGRDAHPALVEVADLVLETTKVKHPMDAGQKGQRGIEW